ncbi:uncharacterized protein LOC141776589 [Sebastes fasciatus]|uniref:uncharacterized protein LOC141776589 n=1 Tax=Sebastes fasciatus TaxID=394691 RepID=UPI003D9E8C82
MMEKELHPVVSGRKCKGIQVMLLMVAMTTTKDSSGLTMVQNSQEGITRHYSAEMGSDMRLQHRTRHTRMNKRKLDSRCEKGIFVGYNKNSPAYLVYCPDSGKVQKHRLVKFVTKTVAERQTQTEMTPDEDDFEAQNRANQTGLNTDVSPGRGQVPVIVPENIILLHHLDSFTSADTLNSRQVFVLLCFTVGGERIFVSGTKLYVTDEPVVKPVVSVYPAASRAHLEGKSSLLCLASAMFPPLVQFSWKRRKDNGPLEELPPAEGEQLELREPGRTAGILLIRQPENSTYKYRCYVHHEGGTVEAPAEQEVPAPAASCPPEREPAHLPALQQADLSFQSQCKVKLLCVLYTVLIVKSLVYCCGLSLLMILRNKGPSTNCTHAD